MNRTRSGVTGIICDPCLAIGASDQRLNPRWAGASERFARISGRRNRKTVGKSNSGWMRAATRRVAQVAA